MINNIPKISVIIICYKQEKLIQRAIDSLVAQKDYIYEICLSDDCSSDKTWEILLRYDKLYPGLFKLHQNHQNVGIFENIEYTWKMPTGDIIYRLAGDDECGTGWFQTVIEYIQRNQIDYKNELFCIYGDYKCIYPNGDSFVKKNNAVLINDNMLKLSLRGVIGNRGCCYSIHILRKFVKCSQGRSHIAEDAIDRQLQIFSEKKYYIPQVANIYYSYVGVSTSITTEVLKERAKIRPYAFALFDKLGAKYDIKDKIYSLEYFPIFERTVFNPTFFGVIQLIYMYIKAYDGSIKGSSSFRSLLFALLRRLPHKKPLQFD